MPWLGLVLGVIVGAAVDGFRGLVIGAAAGVLIGLLLRQRPAAATLPPTPGGLVSGAPVSSGEPANAARIAALERRLAALEAALARSGVALPPVAQEVVPPPATSSQAASRVGATLEVMAAPRSPVRKGGSGEPPSNEAFTAAGQTAAATAAPAAPAPATPRPAPALPAPANPLWSWFTDGNTLVRVGIVVLFFGVAFLLSYLAEHVRLPIEVQFACVALAGAAMILAGAWLHRVRRAYALALIGGGLGVLYLTTFAALQLVPLLSPGSAFTLLAAIALLAIVLSLIFDAQALAALAALGGLLAPVLVETVSEPLPLFGYVAAVSAVVVGIAWFRAWRTLDLVGFVGTFVLSLWWGHEYYEPAYFAVVEPFLVTFFLAYLAVPIVHAFRGAAERRVDATLVFGVPIAAFALQALLVQDTRYGLAWTAAGMAGLYALLWWALRGRGGAASATLAAAFGVLAVIFATLTVPLAVDARWTSAAWAIEAAGVYWLGCRQEHPFTRGFALLLQLASGVAFFFGGFNEYVETAFANRQFLGSVAIALSAFASVRVADRHSKSLPGAELPLLQLLFGWACVWWLGGGLVEVDRSVATRAEAHAMLAWIVGSIVLAALLARPLRWPRLDGTVVILLPALALSLGHDLTHGRTSLTEYGWAIYPLAWALHFALLRRREAGSLATADPAAARQRAQLRPWLVAAHAFGALLLLGQVAWEAGEWTSRVVPPGTVWAACANLLPLALYLLALVGSRRATEWPMRTFTDAYALVAGTVVAGVLGLGFLALALLNPGDSQPLPYVPLANPLELTLLFALAALFLWARHDARVTPRSLYRGLGLGAFIVLNGLVVRVVHHWLRVPWQLQALLASRPLQAALTLTWTIAALGAMVVATKHRLRALWLTGAGLLAAVVIKLFAVDLAALSGLSRVVAFLGVGALLLVIGYVAPLPPQAADRADR